MTHIHVRNLLGKLIALLCLCAALGACGFKLRANDAMLFKTIDASAGGGDVARELRRTLAEQQEVILLTPKPGENRSAQVILEFIDESREKEILGISTTGRAREYQLRLRLKYRLTRLAEVREVAPVQEIVLRRDVTTTDAQLAAKQEEDVLLYRDMQTDMVRQLLRRLAAFKP
jgi:LPS-assembly lipoprotein